MQPSAKKRNRPDSYTRPPAKRKRPNTSQRNYKNTYKLPSPSPAPPKAINLTSDNENDEWNSKIKTRQHGKFKKIRAYAIGFGKYYDVWSPCVENGMEPPHVVVWENGLIDFHILSTTDDVVSVSVLDQHILYYEICDKPSFFDPMTIDPYCKEPIFDIVVLHVRNNIIRDFHWIAELWKEQPGVITLVFDNVRYQSFLTFLGQLLPDKDGPMSISAKLGYAAPVLNCPLISKKIKPEWLLVEKGLATNKGGRVMRTRSRRGFNPFDWGFAKAEDAKLFVWDEEEIIQLSQVRMKRKKKKRKTAALDLDSDLDSDGDVEMPTVGSDSDSDDNWEPTEKEKKQIERENEENPQLAFRLGKGFDFSSIPDGTVFDLTQGQKSGSSSSSSSSDFTSSDSEEERSEDEFIEPSMRKSVKKEKKGDGFREVFFKKRKKHDPLYQFIVDKPKYGHRRSSLSITMMDLTRVTSREYLNDKIIDWFLSYLYYHWSDAFQRQTLVVNSYFYKSIITKRSSRSTNGFAKYGLVILDKDYTIVPLCQSDHWFVIVICYPRMINSESIEERKKCCLVALDSLNLKRRKQLMTSIRQYLTELWRLKHPSAEEEVTFNGKNCRAVYAKSREQPNSVDCGVFLCKNIQLFGEEEQFPPDFNCAPWFSEKEGTDFRKKLLKIIQGKGDLGN